MSKFCSSCGQWINDADTQCRYCGAFQPRGYVNTPRQNGYRNMPGQYGYGNAPYQYGHGNIPGQYGFSGTPQKARKKSKAGAAAIIILISAVVLTAGCLLYFNVIKDIIEDDGSYMTVIDNYCRSYNTNDADLYESTFCDCVKETENYKDSVEDFKKRCAYFTDMTYEVLSKRRMKKDEYESIRESVQKSIKKEFRIQDAYVLELHTSNKYDGEPKSAHWNLPVYKIDGKWGIIYY